MSVYKIFPIQDATLYSEYNTMNTGLDAILELSKTPSYLYVSQSAADRVLVKFSDEDINNVFTNYIGTGSYSASLKMYLADAENIPTDYSLEVRAVYEPWVMGTGKFGEDPLNTTGASWANKAPGVTWNERTLPVGATGSFTLGNTGGANWYTASLATQSFGPYTDKDVDVDVTSIIAGYRSGAYVNNGMLLKNTSTVEFDRNYSYTLQYFSRDTHTIYPPSLDFKWDDSVYSPVSQSLICLNGSINVSLQDNRFSYKEGSIRKVRLNVRDKYPVRAFSTGSLYTVQKYLPSASYWSLVDHKTEDVVIDFDTHATKISADASGNYFTLYMNGLEPERYYQVLIKSVMGGETIIFDNDYIFKVE